LSVGRKFRGSFAAEFFYDAGIVEDGIPDEIWPENFQERGAMTEIIFL